MRGLADADQARISKILTEILTDLRCTGTFRAVWDAQTTVRMWKAQWLQGWPI